MPNVTDVIEPGMESVNDMFWMIGVMVAIGITWFIFWYVWTMMNDN